MFDSILISNQGPAPVQTALLAPGAIDRRFICSGQIRAKLAELRRVNFSRNNAEPFVTQDY